MARDGITDMTRAKAAATRIGMSLEEYVRLKESGWKRCWRCKEWKKGGDMVKVSEKSGDRCKDCNRKMTEERRRTGVKKEGE